MGWFEKIWTRECRIARTFESRCANWHKSCGIWQNQKVLNWITYLKVNCLGHVHEVFSRQEKCSSMFLLEGIDHRGWFKRGVYKRGVHIRKKKKVTANPSPQLSWFHANKILERDLRKGFCKRRSGRVARDTLCAC